MTTPALRVGFGLRVAASLLDLLVLLPFALLLFAALTFLDRANRLSPAVEYLMGVAAAVAGLAYTTFEVFQGATPGKWILKLRIAAADGRPADGHRLLQRWLVKHVGEIVGVAAALTMLPFLEGVSGLLNMLVLLSFLAVLGAGRQTAYDRWAGTAVFRRRDIEHTGFEPLAAPMPVGPSLEQSPPTDAPTDAPAANVNADASATPDVATPLTPTARPPSGAAGPSTGTSS